MKVDEHTKRQRADHSVSVRGAWMQNSQNSANSNDDSPRQLRLWCTSEHVLHRIFAVSLNWRQVIQQSDLFSVSPRSSATGWECWVWVSCRTPPFSCPRRWDQKARGRNKAAGNLHEVLAMRQQVRFYLSPQLSRVWLRQIWPKIQLVLNWGKHISIFSFNWLICF